MYKYLHYASCISLLNSYETVQVLYSDILHRAYTY